MQDMKKRTKEYALGIIRTYSALPRRVQFLPLVDQLLRSGTSVAAQYREACRAKSDADFISKIEGCLQELEETELWLELLSETGYLPFEGSQQLIRETKELNAMFMSMCKGVKNRVSQAKKSALSP